PDASSRLPEKGGHGYQRGGRKGLAQRCESERPVALAAERVIPQVGLQAALARSPSLQRAHAGDLERMVDQLLDPLEEPYRMREAGVKVECGFVHPARVEEEQARVAGGTKGIDPQASGLGAHGLQLLSHHGCDGLVLTRAGMEAGNNKQ